MGTKASLLLPSLLCFLPADAAAPCMIASCWERAPGTQRSRNHGLTPFPEGLTPEAVCVSADLQHGC